MVAKFPSGSVDDRFGTAGAVTTPIALSNDEAYAILVQADGKLVLAGHTEDESGYDFALARYRADGDLDAGFGDGGKVVTAVGGGYDEALALVQQPDGKLLAAGYADGGVALVRYDGDGTLDATFGAGGQLISDVGRNALAMALLPDGRLLVAGAAFAFGTGDDAMIARFEASGELDTTFGDGGRVTTALSDTYDVAAALAVQPDGKLVVAANATDALEESHVVLLRYESDGAVDAGFGDGGRVTVPVPGASAAGLVLQPDGKLVVAGTGAGPFLSRHLPDGTLDGTFGVEGIAAPADASGATVSALVLQPDGKLVVAGQSDEATGRRLALLRFGADGALDTSFGEGGKALVAAGQNAAAFAVAQQPDGKLVAAGYVDDGTAHLFLLARFHP